ncbi:MAG: hypothetical protein GX557_10935, partial [Chloroflexi bacterium]|nr:hypothetical protein [Chloroflexota bacterium]
MDNGSHRDQDRFRRLRDALRHRAPLRDHLDLRPLWRGQAFERWANAPVTLRRARALEAVLDQVALPIHPDEIVVGTPQGALAPALPAGVDSMTYERCAALNARIGDRTFITGCDHLAPDYAHLLAVGWPGLLAEVRASQARQSEPERSTFLESVAITLEAAIRYTARWAAACRAATAATDMPGRDAELLRMAGDLDALTQAPPATLAQALQLIWLIHTIYALEGRGAMAFGRMDQYLYPFYRAALEAGEGPLARAQLACMWAKLEDPLIPNPVQNIAIGGQTRDGRDASNALSHLILQVTGEIVTPRSNLSARLHRGSPRGYLEACCDLIKTGIGFPALFNDEVLVPALVALEVTPEDARDCAFVGCIETFLPGQMPPWSDSRFNLLQCVDRALRNGVDGLDGVQRGVATGAPACLATFEAFMEAYRAQLRHMVAQHCATINARMQVVAEQYTSPFLSALV